MTIDRKNELVTNMTRRQIENKSKRRKPVFDSKVTRWWRLNCLQKLRKEMEREQKAARQSRLDKELQSQPAHTP